MDFEKFSFLDGFVLRRDSAYLLGANDNLMAMGFLHTRCFQFLDGEWGAYDLPWVACSSTFCQIPDHRYLVVSENGDVKDLGGGQVRDGEINPSGIGPRKLGPLLEMRTIAGGRAYVVGTARQAYRRNAENLWVSINQGTNTKDKDLADTCFHSIDGFTELDIYAVGWDGEIWHYNGTEWSQMSSPTNLALYSVICAPDGNVYACGQIGALLRGRHNQWAILHQDDTNEDLWGVTWFNNRLYASSSRFIYELRGDILHRVDMGPIRPPSTCHKLCAVDGILWSIGAKDVMQFDGQNWSRII